VRPPRGGRAAVEWSGGGALYRRARGMAATVGGVPLPRAVAVAIASKEAQVSPFLLFVPILSSGIYPIWGWGKN
jgi:hypothetical protein